MKSCTLIDSQIEHRQMKQHNTSASVTSILSAVFLLILGACSGGGNDNTTPSMNANTAPIVSAGTDQTVQEGAMVQLSGSGSDAESAVSFLWNQTAGPSVNLSSNSDVNASFTAPDVDSDTQFEFTLTVTDDVNATAIDQAIIMVQNGQVVNTPPTVNAGVDQSVDENISVTLMGVGADVEGSVSYQWQQTAGMSTALDTSKRLTDSTPYILGDGHFIIPSCGERDALGEVLA